jgi:AbrB family looped-hinge helix DNA binding protein
VLPASIRKRVGLHPGDRLVLIAEDSGEIRIVGLRQQVQGCQGMFQRSGSRGVRPSEELIAERRLEAAREKRD